MNILHFVYPFICGQILGCSIIHINIFLPLPPLSPSLVISISVGCTNTDLVVQFQNLSVILYSSLPVSPPHPWHPNQQQALTFISFRHVSILIIFHYFPSYHLVQATVPLVTTKGHFTFFLPPLIHFPIAINITFSKYESDHATSVLKTLPWLPLTLE